MKQDLHVGYGPRLRRSRRPARRREVLGPVLRSIDARFGRLPVAVVLLLAVALVGAVALVDQISGYEISLSILYLGPTVLAAWYGGRSPALAVALLSCICWYLADALAGARYSNAAIPVWNAAVRLGFFASTAMLVDALAWRLADEALRSTTDGLTGLLNLRGLKDRLSHDLELARRTGRALTLVFVDLDGFKRVNDELGHRAGDRVLERAAAALATDLRRSDSAGRIGGDEFVLVLAETDAAGAVDAVARARTRLGDAFAGDAARVTASFGVVSFERAPESAADALEMADRLMYEAKRRGRDAVTFGAVDPGTGEISLLEPSS